RRRCRARFVPLPVPQLFSQLQLPLLLCRTLWSRHSVAPKGYSCYSSNTLASPAGHRVFSGPPTFLSRPFELEQQQALAPAIRRQAHSPRPSRRGMPEIGSFETSYLIGTLRRCP